MFLLFDCDCRVSGCWSCSYHLLLWWISNCQVGMSFPKYWAPSVHDGVTRNSGVSVSRLQPSSSKGNGSLHSHNQLTGTQSGYCEAHVLCVLCQDSPAATMTAHCLNSFPVFPLCFLSRLSTCSLLLCKLLGEVSAHSLAVRLVPLVFIPQGSLESSDLKAGRGSTTADVILERHEL